jgi:carbamoyl-phosphate synthase large subunit
MYNILILSAGRRVELIQKFDDARKKLAIKSKIIAADMSEQAPAIYHADKYEKLPHVYSDNYIEELIKVCLDNDVKAIIPTIDTELPVLTENKDLIEEKVIKVLISDKNVINICNDKFNTYDFFKENNIDTPLLIEENDLKDKNYSFPLFIKPKDGSSSKNTFKINSKSELDFFYDYVPDPIVLNFIEGEEYTIDCFVDFDHNPISIVPRKRIATRGGEISKGQIVLDENIINETKKIIKLLKPVGPITVQCIKSDNKIKFFEINPRFGGGSPISITAGANSPVYIYRLLKGESLKEENNIKDGLIALRYDQAVFLDNSEVIKL